jgi:nitroreductase
VGSVKYEYAAVEFCLCIERRSFYDDLLSCLVEKNQLWAKNAPMLFMTVAEVISAYNDQPNRYAWHDTGMAYATLVFQATIAGLYAHPMGGFDREKAARVANIPERFEPVAFAAIGYRSGSAGFPPELVSRENSERKRKPLDDLVFHGRFGNRSGLTGT